LLTACATEPAVEYRTVEVSVPVYHEIPDEFTRELDAPELPRGEITNEDLADYIELQKRFIRTLQGDRQKVKQITDQPE
jgi:hypothetical protein